MLNQKQFLSPHIFTKSLETLSNRDGYGQGLVLAGEHDPNIVVLAADLSDSTKASLFKEKFPTRFIEVGVAEQALATIGSGMANYGKIPFLNSYAIFSPGRNWEQIRTTICLNNVPVKIIGSHAGITVGPDGGSSQALEDIALMRTLPNMIVVVPADSQEAQKATQEIAKNQKIYFWDTGVRNALINEFSLNPLRGDIGALWENWVIAEFGKQNALIGKRKNLYFWRARTGGEVDLVIKEGTKINAYEIKWSKKSVSRQSFSLKYGAPVQLIDSSNPLIQI